MTSSNDKKKINKQSRETNPMFVKYFLNPLFIELRKVIPNNTDIDFEKAGYSSKNLVLLINALFRQYLIQDNKVEYRTYIVDLEKVKKIEIFPEVLKREKKPQGKTSEGKKGVCVKFKYGSKDLGYVSTKATSTTRLFLQLFKAPSKEMAYFLITVSVLLGKQDVFKNEKSPIFDTITKSFDNVSIIQNYADELIGGLNTVLYERHKYSVFIDSTKTLQSLEKEWNIHCKDQDKNLYNANKIRYSAELSNVLSKSMPDEVIFFVTKRNNLSARVKNEVDDIIRLTARIEVSSDRESKTLKFSVSNKPLYSACQKLIEQKTQNTFAKRKYQFGLQEMKNFLGECAEKARSNIHVIETRDCTEEQKVMLDLAVDHKLLERFEKKEGSYRFATKYIRLFLNGYRIASVADKDYLSPVEENVDFGKKVVDKILSFSDIEDQEKKDHMHYRIIEPVLVASSVLFTVNIALREEIINELINTAECYRSDKRNRQEVAILVLTYLLWADTKGALSFDQIKKIYKSIFSKHLHPSQIPLLRELISRNKFYQENPIDVFNDALKYECVENNYFMKSQPFYTLMQGLLKYENKRYYSFEKVEELFIKGATIRTKSGERGNSRIYKRLKESDFSYQLNKISDKKSETLFVNDITSLEAFYARITHNNHNEIAYVFNNTPENFLELSMLAQYKSLMLSTNKNFHKPEIFDLENLLIDLFKKIQTLKEDDFSIEKNPESALTNIFATEIALYAFANLSLNDTNLSIDDNRSFKLKTATNKEKEHLLKVAIWADYYQKKYNRIYQTDKNSNDLYLICGTYRLLNSFKFDDITVVIDEKIINGYVDYLKDEDSCQRYYWFQLRLLSHISNGVTSIRDKLLNEKNELKKKYAHIVFLKYDGFSSFEEFVEEVEKRTP